MYLRWPEIDLPRLAPLVRLLWGSLIGELISTYDRSGGKDCHPVLCLIDEAGRTAIPSLSDYATTVCGRGITLWVSIQSLSQLDVEYGTGAAKVLRDNMETQLFYRPSDLDTASIWRSALAGIPCTPVRQPRGKGPKSPRAYPSRGSHS